MPYSEIKQLPKGVKSSLPKLAQDIYKKAFNSALKQYQDEQVAHRVAWSAVKNSYERSGSGNWHKKVN